MKKPHLIRRVKYRFGIYGRKSSKFPIRFIIFILIITIISGSLFYYAEKRLSSITERIAVSDLENSISQECNRSVEEIIKEHNIDISSVISSDSTEADNLTSLSTDFSKINILKTQLAERITAKLAHTHILTCKVPSGALFSDSIFAGYGFDIPMRLVVTGSGLVDFTDSFTSAGINQTKYSLSIKVTVNTEVQTVFDSFQKTITVELPIAEKIIVGDVPDRIVGVE